MDSYIEGVLYGDGAFYLKDGYEVFMFSTTHKELADKVDSFLSKNNYRYNHYNRGFDIGHSNENYEVLELIESYDKELHDLLKRKGFKSDKAEDRVKISPDFMRGYLETKGTFFESHSRGSKFWRIALSGTESDIQYIKGGLEQKLNIELSQVTQRNEREEQGIISKSFRVNTQARANVNLIVDYLYNDGDITKHLKHGFESFKNFHSATPFNRKVSVFKTYRSAVLYMARELKLDLKGIRGVSALRRQKPVYLWEDGEVVLCFNNYEKTYFWACEVYKNITGFEAPNVSTSKN